MAHNKYRAIHGSPSLFLDAEITSYAQEWADELSERNLFERRPNCKYGQNLFTAVENNPEWKVQPSDPVISWYSEIEFYTFEEELFLPKALETDRFTQVIWRGTSRLGVGVSTHPLNRVYVVCNYEPRGNTEGQYTKNVLPPAKVAKHKNTLKLGEDSSNTSNLHFLVHGSAFRVVFSNPEG